MKSILVFIGFIGFIVLTELTGPLPGKPRPGGRGQGELYKNGLLPFREAPRGSAGRLHTNSTNPTNSSNLTFIV